MDQPKTVEEAVQRLVDEIPKEGIDRISAMAEEHELYGLHHGLGRAIRNTMGLWQTNSELLADCKRVALENGQELTKLDLEEPVLGIHPDDASHAILVQLWKKLREPVPEFKRELKYEVTKLDDIEKYLTRGEDLIYCRLLDRIREGRAADGKVACNSYVVVNAEEDYAEQVWALIEDGERRKALKAAPDPDQAEVPEWTSEELNDQFYNALFKARCSGLWKDLPTVEGIEHALEVLQVMYGHYHFWSVAVLEAMEKGEALKAALEAKAEKQ